jgi:hypothetical protein
MKILAIDPGERVGWATGEILWLGPDGKHYGEYAKLPQEFDNELKRDLVVRQHGITALKPFALKLDEVFADYDVIVYERFVLASGKAKELAGSDMQTSQLIGMIRLNGWRHPQVKLVAQWPANMATAEKSAPPWLREILDGLPKAHDDSHDGSALLHLWYWFWKRYV